MSETPTPDVPVIDIKDLKLLWHEGYWDGMLSGVVERDGETLYFDMERENEDDRNRLFVLYRLSPKDLAVVRERHAAFREHVGWHTDIDENGDRRLGALHPRENWRRFYDDPRWTQKTTMSTKTPIAKFWWFNPATTEESP